MGSEYIPVYINFDHSRLVGRASHNKDRNILTIEISDPAMIDFLTDRSLRGLSIDPTPAIDINTETRINPYE